MKFDEKLLDYWGADAGNLVEKIFMHLYRELPNVYSISFAIDVEQVLKKLQKKFNLTDEDFIIKNEEACKDDWLKVNYSASDYLLRIKDRILLYVSAAKTEVYYSPDIDFVQVKDLVKVLKSKSRAKRQAHRSFFLLRTDSGNFSLEKIEFAGTDIDLSLFFNEDIIDFHNSLIDFLKDKNRRGIALIYGKHGSGKTAYLKYLIANSDLKFILLPRSVYSSLDSVRLYSFLRDFRDAVLILEDCDNLLSGMAKTNPLTGFLQNAEGLLADNYSYKLICTTSLAEHQINPEYIRKAPEILRYNMRELARNRVIALRKKMGLDVNVNGAMTLDQALNPENKIFRSKKLGFNS